MIRPSSRLTIVLALMIAAARPAAAQGDDAAVLKLAEPDFALVALPTNLRVPTLKSAFRVTHRFTRPLGQGDFASLAEDLFGLDAGAQIGLEFRIGLVPNGQVGIHRTSDKTIEFFGQYSVLRQGGGSPLDVSARVGVEGTNNFRDSYSPALGAIVSRKIGEVAALYVEPLWVNNTNPLPGALVDHNNTFLVGLGGRVRVRPTVYLVGEFAPRTGYAPGDHHASFAIEKRAGGHTFQLNFSTDFATTMGQIARGASTNEDWYLGFNISRKFY